MLAVRGALFENRIFSARAPGVTTLGGLAGLAPEPVTGIQRALGEPTGSPWPPAQPSGRQWRRQVRELEREQHPHSARSAVPTETFFLRAGTAGAVAGIAPGPRAPDQRSRAAQISSRVYGALVGRPADALPPATAPCFCAAAALSCSILLPLAHCHRRPSSLQSGIKSRGRAWEAARAVHKKQLKQFDKKCEDEAAARALAARRTTFCCQFLAHGCKFPPFLQEARAKTHAAKYCVFNPLHEKHG